MPKSETSSSNKYFLAPDKMEKIYRHFMKILNGQTRFDQRSQNDLDDWCKRGGGYEPMTFKNSQDWVWSQLEDASSMASWIGISFPHEVGCKRGFILVENKGATAEKVRAILKSRGALMMRHKNDQLKQIRDSLFLVRNRLRFIAAKSARLPRPNEGQMQTILESEAGPRLALGSELH